MFKKGTKALNDAGITYDKVEEAFVGYVYGSYRGTVPLLYLRIIKYYIF